MKSNHIWIIRTGALGDFILTMPVVSNVRENYPNAQITLLGNTNTLTLAQEDVTHIYDINRADWAPLFAPNAKLPPSLTENFKATDLAISYLPDSDGIFSTNLKRAGIHTIMTHPPKPPTDGSIHAVDHLLQPLHKLNIPIRTTQPAIHLTEQDHNAIAPYKQQAPTILIHPGSGGAPKRWPPKHFITLINTITEHTNYAILVSTGPADGELAHQITTQSPATPLPQLPIRHLAALLTQCHAYIGNDSGPSHLAAAMGIPTLALFGPTDPHTWSPRGVNVHIIQSPDEQMTSISPTQVFANLKEIIPLNP